MFITAFAAIPAAAQPPLVSLIELENFKNEEQRTLFKSCDYGDGKYGSCNKLVEILSKECDDDRRYLSCELNALLLLTLNRDEEAINYLVKSCDANLMTSCLCLNWEDLYFTGNTDRVLKSFKKYVVWIRNLHMSIADFTMNLKFVWKIKSAIQEEK